jgi:hypothetical protein
MSGTLKKRGPASLVSATAFVPTKGGGCERFAQQLAKQLRCKATQPPAANLHSGSPLEPVRSEARPGDGFVEVPKRLP